MFTCPKCKTDWSENYCPACAKTIEPAPIAVTTEQAKPSPAIARTATTASPVSEFTQLTHCLRWFSALFVVDLASFVLIMIFVDRNRAAANLLLAVAVIVRLLAIYALVKLCRVVGSYRPLYSLLFVLIPPIAILAFLVLCQTTLNVGAQRGYRLSILPPHILAILGYATMIMLGCYLFYRESAKLIDHARLKQSGVPISGTLQYVTKHTVNLLPAGYTFTINYAGRSKTFDVDSTILSQNTLPDGKFTHHEISLVYLPDKPDVAELPGMLKFHGDSLLGFGMGGFLAVLGNHRLRRVITIKPTR